MYKYIIRIRSMIYLTRRSNNMRDKFAVALIAAVLIGLFTAGVVSTSNNPAHSEQSLEFNIDPADFEPGLISWNATKSSPDILIAQSECGNQTCSEKECCCLNVETGTKCCRPIGNHPNCVEACKKSKAC